MTTDLFDPASTGEIHLHDSVIETAVLPRDVGESTRVIRVPVHPPAMLTRPDQTAVIYTAMPPREGILLADTMAFQPPMPGSPPPHPLPPSPVPPPGPGWNGRVAEYPVVKPLFRRGRRRAVLPTWALLVACFGAGSMGGVTVLTIAVAVAQ